MAILGGDMRKLLLMISALCAVLTLVNCAGVPQGTPNGPVVLDIGHCIGAGGAVSARPVKGQRIQELEWWYRYVYYTKRVIQQAGYEVRVINRGNPPEPGTELASFARRARVLHMRKPDNGERYPSRYVRDRVASGIISADYAIYSRASCAVFLHHNSGRGWTRGASPSLIICNRHNGRRLGACLAASLENRVLNHGMPNGGRGCSVVPRYVDADRSAGWMNACDDAGIPAAVVEAAFLNNAGHVAYLADEITARKYAEAVGHGIVNYLRRYGHEPRHYRTDISEPDEGSFGYAAESRRLDVPGARHLL